MSEVKHTPGPWTIGPDEPSFNVYEGDRPVCQCHTSVDARRIVEAVNAKQAVSPQAVIIPEPDIDQWYKDWCLENGRGDPITLSAHEALHLMAYGLNRYIAQVLMAFALNRYIDESAG